MKFLLWLLSIMDNRRVRHIIFYANLTFAFYGAGRGLYHAWAGENWEALLCVVLSCINMWCAHRDGMDRSLLPPS